MRFSTRKTARQGDFCDRMRHERGLCGSRRLPRAPMEESRREEFPTDRWGGGGGRASGGNEYRSIRIRRSKRLQGLLRLRNSARRKEKPERPQRMLGSRSRSERTGRSSGHPAERYSLVGLQTRKIDLRQKKAAKSRIRRRREAGFQCLLWSRTKSQK